MTPTPAEIVAKLTERDAALAQAQRYREALEMILEQTDTGPEGDWHGMLGTVTIQSIARQALKEPTDEVR